jgi:hypothetical protein
MRDLIELLSLGVEATLSLPCPARAKLGDGTVAALALHTADTYHGIAGLLGGADTHTHGDAYRSEDTDLRSLLDRLSAAQAALAVLANLLDRQLDSVLPASDMRFCDGKRTLEQIVTSMLRHQAHNVEAVKSAVSAA